MWLCLLNAHFIWLLLYLIICLTLLNVNMQSSLSFYIEAIKRKFTVVLTRVEKKTFFLNIMQYH